MTLRQPNIDRLLQLGLSGMAEALEEQRDIADVDQLGFNDRLALMIEREAEHRDHKSYLGHLRQAQLRIRADIQDVDCRAGRGIARTTLTQLAAGDWIRQGHNLILGGPTGSGKTFVACALAHQACRQHQSVLYRRVPELVAALIRARDKGTLERLMGRLGRVSLLVLDDWGLQGFSAEGRRDLLEIVEQRHGRKSILIASQIPVDGWPKVIGEPTIADAVLDRIVHRYHEPVASTRLRVVRGTRREGPHLLSGRNRQQRSGRMSDYPSTTALTGARHSTVYVAVEISLKSWIVGMHCPDASGGCISIHKLATADTAGLVELAGSVRERVARELGARPRVMLTYEAGYEGFWLARDIERRDAEIEIFMNDPASLQVNRRAKRKKTDRIDTRKMLRALKAWDQGDSEAMSWVRVPAVDREDDKRLLRERETLIVERTRLNNRIRGLLMLHGIFDLAPRRADFLDRLAAARTGYGAPLPPRARAEIERAVAVLRLVEAHIDTIEAEKKALLKAGRKAVDAPNRDGTAVIAALTRIHGIGLNDATLLAGEVFYRDFRNRRELGSWAGLTSVPWASGGVDHDLGISKAGPSHIRKHMIQMSWRWLKLQPESGITKWFHAYVARAANGGRDKRARKRAIVGVARKLLIALWRYATQGLVPEGAIVS